MTIAYLEALSKEGIIECIEPDNGNLCRNITEPHSHINCLDTRQIMDIYVQLPSDLLEKIETQTPN